MDIKRALRSAVSTGTVYLGASETKKAIGTGKVKLVIISKNCKKNEMEAITKASVPIYKFEGTNVELGAACGKPFSVSVLSILKPGDSDILTLKKEASGTAKKKVAKKKAA